VNVRGVQRLGRGNGLVVVVEGQRINLRVYRRIFAPVQRRLDDEAYVVYSDTGREKEISYGNADYYGLDDPFSRFRLVKLARAMNCLRCEDAGTGERMCTVTICLTRELSDSETDDKVWTPFDPERLEPLEDRVRKMRRKSEWRRRVRD
jgi:hypothetical protein